MLTVLIRLGLFAGREHCCNLESAGLFERISHARELCNTSGA